MTSTAPIRINLRPCIRNAVTNLMQKEGVRAGATAVTLQSEEIQLNL